MKTRLSFLLPVTACGLLSLLTPIIAADELPLKRVVLFTSGVGFFQREGEVTGDTSIDLSFRPEQINDLLKSMVLQDFGGGRIAPVVFSTRDPIERTLKSFAIDLTDNPPLAQLLNRMKVVSMRNALSDLQRRRGQIERQISEISQEQTRIRDNMKVLPQNSELYGRYIKKFDEQETQLEGLREQLARLRADEESQRKKLDDYMTGLQVE